MPEEQHSTQNKTTVQPSNAHIPHPILSREEPPEPVILEEHVVEKKPAPSESPAPTPSTPPQTKKFSLGSFSALGSLVPKKKVTPPTPPAKSDEPTPSLGIRTTEANSPVDESFQPHSLGVSVPPPPSHTGREGEQEATQAPHIHAFDPLQEKPQEPSAAAITEEHIPAITTVMPKSPEENAGRISSILGSVKLPERKEFRAKADTPAYENKMAPLAPSSPEPTPLVAPQEPQKKKEFDIPSVHTLRDDLDQLVEGQKLSMVRAAALEEDKRNKGAQVEKQVAQPKRGTGRLIRTVLLSMFLILLGGGALATIAIVASQRETPSAPPTLSSIMFSEKTLSFPIDNLSATDVKKQLSLARSQVPLSLGAIARIVPTEKKPGTDGGFVETPLATEDFFNAIGARLPEGFSRSLSNEFFFGVHALDQNSPVLVLPVAVYERAFAGALAWEKNMNEDLEPIFAAVPAQTITKDGTVVSRKFEDVIIQNYDVRIIRDSSGSVRLLYAFPTRDILIIAESPNSFTETLARLRAERRL